MPTDCLFRDDAYLRDCEAAALALSEHGRLLEFRAVEAAAPTWAARARSGAVRVTQIEKKGKLNRRVRIAFA